MNVEKCTGVIFRGYQNQYFDKEKCSFNYREGFRLLKRKSCKCQGCREIIGNLTKCGDGETLLDCSYWFDTFQHKPIDDGSEYRLTATWDTEWGEGDTSYGDYIEEVKMEKIS